MKINVIYAAEKNPAHDISPAPIDAPSEKETGRSNPGIDHDIQSLARNYRSFLIGHCRRLTHGNYHDANELFSQAMEKLCSESPAQLRDIGHMGGWLTRVVRNQFIDHQRERQASARRDNDLSYLSEAFDLTSPSPEQEYLNGELNQHLHLAFEALPAKLRTIALMRFCEEASYEEISGRLSINPVNARKSIQEARKLLAVSIRGYVGEDASPPRAAAPRRPSRVPIADY